MDRFLVAAVAKPLPFISEMTAMSRASDNGRRAPKRFVLVSLHVDLQNLKRPP